MLKNLKSWKLWGLGVLIVAFGIMSRRPAKTAVDWYNEGCEKNRNGNYGEAVGCYAKAAEMGLAPAQGNLAIHYLNGVGVEKNQPLAIEWFSKASDAGYGPAQLAMAGFYSAGLIVPKNVEKADALFFETAQKGIPQAQYMYAHTCIRKKDIESAKQWLLKAESAGMHEAYYTMGLLTMKESANGVDAKSEEGYAHLLVSVRIGGANAEPLAKSLVDAFERVSKPEWIARGKERAEQMLKSLGSKRPSTEFNPASA